MPSKFKKNITKGDAVVKPYNQEIHINDESAKTISAAVVTSLEPLFLKLSSEILSLKYEVEQLKPQKPTEQNIIPKIPFNDDEEFNKFERHIAENEYAVNTLEKNLKSISNNGGRFVKNCWRKFFTDSFAEKHSWRGTNDKKCIKNLTITLAIKNAAIGCGFEERHFVNETKGFFQFAKNRQKQREEYQKKSQEILGT